MTCSGTRTWIVDSPSYSYCLEWLVFEPGTTWPRGNDDVGDDVVDVATMTMMIMSDRRCCSCHIGTNEKHISLSIRCYRPDNMERVCSFIVQTRGLCTIDWLMQRWTNWWVDGLMFADDEWWHFTVVQLSLEVARSYCCQDPTVACTSRTSPHMRPASFIRGRVGWENTWIKW